MQGASPLEYDCASTTSSIFFGSSPLRSTNALRAVVISFSTGTDFSDPPYTPTAVRTGETIAALLMGVSSADYGTMRERQKSNIDFNADCRVNCPPDGENTRT